jgi:hypothetical protein
VITCKMVKVEKLWLKEAGQVLSVMRLES